MKSLEHQGLEQFRKGTFGNGGDNLFVDAKGVIRRIVDNDLNGDGIFDIALPNSHGYIERAPTFIYTRKGAAWEKAELPHDSCWMPRVADVDGDGIPELVIAAREGIQLRKASDLRRVWQTLPCDHCSWVKAADINHTGRPDIIASRYCSTKSYDTDSLVFWNTGQGYRADQVTAFETHGPMGCTAADLDHDGIEEIIFCNTMRGPSQYDPEFPVFVYYGTPDHQYTALTRREYPVKFGSGHLDLLLPFYSTTEARELPARIFRGDGAGNFDWDHPLKIDCLASIAFCPVDLTGRGLHLPGLRLRRTHPPLVARRDALQDLAVLPRALRPERGGDHGCGVG